MIARATVWNGRRGAVILGPTEHRVARYLADRTRTGRVTIRNAELVADLGIARSELYRITARLRVLGLFGIENDRGGNHGGRRFWRTAIAHDIGALDAAKHREAWARVVAWARDRRGRLAARLASLKRRPHTAPVVASPSGRPGLGSTAPAALSFGAAMRRYGLGPLMDRWRIPDDG